MPAAAASTRGYRLRDVARLLVALIGLYALALTPLLTRTSAALGAAHPGVICQQSAEPAESQDRLPSQTHHHADECCVAAATATQADPPVAEAIPLVWPRDRAFVPAWTDAAASPRPTSTRSTARPRAPPAIESIG